MLTTEQILDAAEEVLRKFGPRKTTVVDVARVLDISHGTVYRHFASKAALHEAIATRWIEQVTTPLAAITNKDASPQARLREWFEMLNEIKQSKAKDDPEMFAAYSLLAKKLSEQIVFGHIETMIQQVEQILIAGKEQGIFDIEDCATTAHTLFHATVRYHHPLHANEWHDENIKQDFEHLYCLLERAILKQ